MAASRWIRARDTTEVEKRKRSLEKQIDTLRRSHLKSEEILGEDTDFSETLGWEYFSNANMQLVYLFLTIEKYQSKTNEIATLLGLSEGEMQRILMRLNQLGVLTSTKGTYKAKPFVRHLSEDSPFIQSFRLGHRLKAANRLQAPADPRDYFFSAVFSADQKAANTIRHGLLDLVALTHKSVAKAAEEEVFQINLDFVNWT